MTQLYTIPDLEWEQTSERRAVSYGQDRSYEVRHGEGQWACWSHPGGWQPCNSLDHGKQLCNQHWHKRMAACLQKYEPCQKTVVTGTSMRGGEIHTCRTETGSEA